MSETNQERTLELILKLIEGYKLNILAYVGMYREYDDNWSSELFNKLLDELDEECTNNLSGGPVTIEELMSFDHDTLINKIGLGIWTSNKTEEGDKYVYALPIWLLPILDQDAEVYCIFDLSDEDNEEDDNDNTLSKIEQTDKGKPMKLSETDKDVRFGCIAYGFAKYYYKQAN